MTNGTLNKCRNLEALLDLQAVGMIYIRQQLKINVDRGARDGWIAFMTSWMDARKKNWHLKLDGT